MSDASEMETARTGAGPGARRILVALVLALLALAAPAAQADPVTHPSLVPQVPATGYPMIHGEPAVPCDPPVSGCFASEEVFAIAQAGRVLVVGGNFDQIELQDGSLVGEVGTPMNLALIDIDTKELLCQGLVASSDVLAAAAGPTPDTAYIAGKFGSITDPAGKLTTTPRIALIHTDTCTVDDVDGFHPATITNRIDELALVGDRLFIGGDFEAIGGQAISTLAELDPETGALRPAFHLTVVKKYFGSGPTEVTSRVRALAASPDGTRLIVAGRWESISDGVRTVGPPTAVIDISDPAAPHLTAHASSGYAAPIQDMTDASIAPDGSVVGLVYGTATSSDYTVLTPTTETAVTPRWQHYMRDSTFAVAVTNRAMYVGGHFCRPDGGPGAVVMDFHFSLNSCTGTEGPGFPDTDGGVWRTKLAALDLETGVPLEWNPGMDAFRGSFRMVATTRGLLVGFDGNHAGATGQVDPGVHTGALAFFDFGPAAEDAAAPSTVTFSSPLTGLALPSPVTIAGSATDDVRVVTFRLALGDGQGRFRQADGTWAATRYEQVLPAAHGAFSLALALPDGTYTAEAVAVDPRGDTSPSWTSRVIAVGPDSVVPTASFTAPDDVLTEQQLTLSGSASDDRGVALVTVAVRDASGRYVHADGTLGGAANLPLELGPALPAAATDWTAHVAAGLPAGDYTVAVTVKDTSGLKQVVSGAFTIGAAAPTVETPTVQPLPNGGLRVAGVVTDGTKVAGVSVTIRRIAGSTWVDSTSRLVEAEATLTPNVLHGLGTRTATFRLDTGYLPPGAYRVTVRAVDGVANGASNEVPSSVPLRAAFAGAKALRAAPAGMTGYRLRVKRRTSLLALGVLDANGNGVLDGRGARVGIWRGGRLLAAVTIGAGAPASRGWIYGRLPKAVVLNPRTTYVVAVLRRAGAEAGRAARARGIDPALTLGARVTRTGTAFRAPTVVATGKARPVNLRLAP